MRKVPYAYDTNYNKQFTSIVIAFYQTAENFKNGSIFY